MDSPPSVMSLHDDANNNDDDDSLDLNEDCGWENTSQTSTSSKNKVLWEEDPSTSFSDWKIIIQPCQNYHHHHHNDDNRDDDNEDETTTTTTTNQQVYHVHKSHLATGKRKCRYFESLFHLPLETIESQNSESILQLPELCVSVFPLFLNFVYEGTLQFKKDNVVPLLELARRLENRDLDLKAKQWIKQSLKSSSDGTITGGPASSLVFLCHALELNMEKLQVASMKIITSNFCEFFRKNETSVIVEHAGVEAVNGTYERRGFNDNVGKFVKRGTWEGEDAEFLIYRCRLRSVGKIWLIAIKFKGTKSGTPDIVPYCAGASDRQNELPPAFDWCGAGKDAISPPPKIIWKSTYFLSQLPFELLVQLLESDDLHVESEDGVYDTVASLVRIMDLTEEQEETLWGCVRFSQLSEGTIGKLSEVETLPWKIVAKDLIRRVGRFDDVVSSACDNSSSSDSVGGGGGGGGGGALRRFYQRKCLSEKQS